MTKIIRSSTVPSSINVFCKGLLSELKESEGYEILVLSSPGPDLDLIKKREKVRTVAVQMERHISPFKDIRSLWNLVYVLYKEKPQMIHSITPKAGLLCMLAAWICRIPIRVHTFTGLVFPTAKGLTQRILITTDRITCACATHVVPEGEGVKHDLEKYRITHKPLHVLGHGNVRGIDLDHYDRTPDVMAKASSIRKPNVFTFIFVGRLVGDKGINELVEAFTRLNEKYPDTRLILVGGQEPHLDPLKPATIKEIECNKAIEDVGRQQDVRPWFAAAECLVFPSYREGFPNVVIEAGAMGLPSIVTNINGSREIIIEGRNGIIIPSHNVDSLFEAMESLLTEKEKRIRMAQEARSLIASRYEQSYVRKCLKQFYHQILSGGDN